MLTFRKCSSKKSPILDYKKSQISVGDERARKRREHVRDSCVLRALSILTEMVTSSLVVSVFNKRIPVLSLDPKLRHTPNEMA